MRGYLFRKGIKGWVYETSDLSEHDALRKCENIAQKRYGEAYSQTMFNNKELSIRLSDKKIPPGAEY